jgi:hypothetical protein
MYNTKKTMLIWNMFIYKKNYEKKTKDIIIV